MKQTFLLLIILGFSAFAIHACKKTPPPKPDNPWGLPNATQKGYNIFACRINGENWISEKGIRNMGGWLTDSAMAIKGSIIFSESSSESIYLYILNNDIKENMIYRLNDTSNYFANYFGVNVECFIPNTGDGSVEIKGYDGEVFLSKIDTVKKILSGTFWFNILTDHCDTMKVTDGRFDINYY